jgi:hypothetical protein
MIGAVKSKLRSSMVSSEIYSAQVFVTRKEHELDQSRPFCNMRHNPVPDGIKAELLGNLELRFPYHNVTVSFICASSGLILNCC